MKDLYIIGAGGLGREILWLVRELNAVSPSYDVVGFVDDDPAKADAVVCGLPVLGGLDWLRSKPGACAALGIGIPRVKEKLLGRLSEYDLEWPSLVAPGVAMSEHVTLGRGAVVCAGSILTTQIDVGDFVLINLACTVGHDARIARGCTLSPGVNMSGFVSVGEYTDIGTGAAIIPGITIGSRSVVGAGTVIIRAVPDGVTVVGNPGRVLAPRT